MEKVIKDRLKKIEETYGVTIIYAVESGSRAWGFASSDSDYDVRFIYVQRTDWHVSIHRGRDVIEVMDKELDLDFSGWELGKALGLLYKGNPPLLEWLNSPMVYKDMPEYTQELKTLALSYYSVKNAIYHYVHMAEGNWKSYIKDRDPVLTKKYLYIIRPLLACMWIETNGTMAPMEIDKTVPLLVSNGPWHEVATLIDKKKTGQELGVGIPNMILNQWIENRLEYYTKYAKSLKNTEISVEPLNQYLRRTVYKLNETR